MRKTRVALFVERTIRPGGPMEHWITGEIIRALKQAEINRMAEDMARSVAERHNRTK